METVNSNKPYIFSTGLNVDSNLESFTNALREAPGVASADTIPDEFQADDMPENNPNIPVDFPESDSDSPDDERHLGKGIAENGGRALARAVDRVASVVLAFIAHGEPVKYRADKAEMNDIQDAFIEFMLETGFVMSPGWNLTVALLSIYGFKAMGALHDRREYEKKESDKNLSLDRK